MRAWSHRKEAAARRVLVVRALAAVMTVALLAAACGETTETTDESGAGAPDEPVTQAEAEPAKDPTELEAELTIFAWEGGVAPLQEWDEAFSEKYPNIKLNYEIQPTAETYQKLLLAITSGSGAPDVSLIEDSHLSQFVELGGLADVTEQVQPYLERMNSYKWTATKLDGRYHAIPWGSGPVGVFYRRDVFEQAGVDPEAIDTWDDYYQAALTIKDTVGVPMWPESRAHNDARLFEMLMWQRGLGYVDDGGNVILDTEPKILEILEYMGRFWDEELASDTQPWTDPRYEVLRQGEVASVVAAAWMGTFLKSWIAPDTGGNWGVFRLPVWEPGDAQASNDGGAALAILEQSEQKEAAWAWIEFVAGRVEPRIRAYEKFDIFPALEDAYIHPFFKEPDPYFGDQEVRSLFSEIVQDVPSAGVYNANYAEMNEIMSVEIQRFATGEQTAKEALASAANQIRASTGRS